MHYHHYIIRYRYIIYPLLNYLVLSNVSQQSVTLKMWESSHTKDVANKDLPETTK